jgi:hypothetical protein
VRQTKLDRLRARGTVIIEADRDGYKVTWWPTGQKGNFLVGRGGRGRDMDALVAQLEEETRPATRDWDYARSHREWCERLEQEQRQRARMRQYDREDRLRHRRDLERIASQERRAATAATRERERVRRVLAG